MTSNKEIAFGIVLYCSVSLATVFFNRYIFTTAFKFPVFVSWLQQVVGLLCYILLSQTGKHYARLSFLPIVKVNLDTVKSVIPMCVTFVAMLSFANICLKQVYVSTYQTARSLTLLFNLLLSKLVLSAHISRLSWCACFAVIFGFVVGSCDRSTLSTAGVITGSCSSFFQALYSVLVKRSLHLVDDNTNVLLFYTLLVSTVLFIPAIFLAGEFNVWEDIVNGHLLRQLFPILCSGLLGITLTFATYYCIKATSPVTFSVLGYGKACVQSLMGIVFLGEKVTVQSISGILLTLAGSFWYSLIKIGESKQAASESVPDPRELKRVIGASEGKPISTLADEIGNDDDALELATLKDPSED